MAWIKCSDRMPEPGDVFVYRPEQAPHVSVAYWIRDHDVWLVPWSQVRFARDEFTHWMPLPEPPT